VSVLNTLVGNLLVWLVASLSLACKSCMSPGRLSVHLALAGCASGGEDVITPLCQTRAFSSYV
jgi:hypothetical protein